MTLAEFLLARIAEDEAVAISRRDDSGAANASLFDEPWQLLDDQHNVWLLIDFRRVLVECEAKRHLVDEHVDGHRCEWGDWTMPGECKAKVLRFLAQPYADHPDYRQEWVPQIDEIEAWPDERQP